MGSQSGTSGGRDYGLHDDFVAGQRPVAPVQVCRRTAGCSSFLCRVRSIQKLALLGGLVLVLRLYKEPV